MEEKDIFTNFPIIDKNKMENYQKPGVWALFGKEKNNSNSKYICLNVGKAKNIQAELKIDFDRLSELKQKSKKKYINQFAEVKFEYDEYPSRLDYLYNEISNNYKNLVFILVAEENDYCIEKYFAYSLKAAYWVSNGGYSDQHEEIDDGIIEKILLNEKDKNKTNKKILNIFKKIDEFKKHCSEYLKKTNCT